MSEQPTPYPDINEVLGLLATGLVNILGKRLAGLYLTGSLSYGDFDRGSSDIDFLAVTTTALTDQELDAIKELHQGIGERVPFWKKRIEGNYILQEWLKRIECPVSKRPYFNNGKLSHYKFGNEWILNLFVLRESGIALYGPDPSELIDPIAITEVRAASKKDLHEDWAQKLEDPRPFEHAGYDSAHLRAYAILTMCRILHRARNDSVVSKRAASRWAKEIYPQWSQLIEAAENWKHGERLSSDEEVKSFIRFTLKEVGS